LELGAEAQSTLAVAIASDVRSGHNAALMALDHFQRFDDIRADAATERTSRHVSNVPHRTGIGSNNSGR